jgi:hypothetical protein
VAPAVYDGSGPLSSELDLTWFWSFADRISRASRHGNAIAGFDAAPLRCGGRECSCLRGDEEVDEADEAVLAVATKRRSEATLLKKGLA